MNKGKVRAKTKVKAACFDPKGVVKPFGAFSNAAWADGGRLLFLSGQVAFDEKGRIVGVGDVKAQTRQVIRNLQRCLEDVGGSLSDIRCVNVFVTSMSFLKDIHEVRKELFKPPYPASTLVEVVSLVHPNLLIEINAIAVVP